jgi:putative endonuclease
MWQQFKNLLRRASILPETSTGERGECMAAAFLQRQGYVVVARNWRSPADRRDELDLVCLDGTVLVFVEVKTRAAHALVSGFHAVNARKKAVVRRAATAYMRRLRPVPHTYRFDVVEVSIAPQGTPEVRHYENVELFSKHFRP